MPHYTKEVPSANQHAKTTYTPITTTTITNMLFHSLVNTVHTVTIKCDFQG